MYRAVVTRNDQRRISLPAVSWPQQGQAALVLALGQGQGSNTQAILAAAGNAAEQLVQSAAPTSATSTLAAAGPAGAPAAAG